jgi:hypothetical protein
MYTYRYICRLYMYVCMYCVVPEDVQVGRNVS